ncbi:DNA (cytosine-5-)-methyltransferase [Mucilaginibacter rubeus]|uniref:Cytosine-specific methyltransferase n=1 Tax=Mucilaginibacter rubeus TaxID=2027860 RepID=A0AAE6JJF2_9SPHI|nr:MULTISPECIES: DNA (cytosine-5-)-methyltransferase [Mucilaginibacter]QEM06761.1 DNA (cytosine-5-)-methyltransferase [Mucilaginibacter rubeus]QEM19349.1 DNA (cytosine-5-)-methyltransferase [Mucilaginibacter gossypii]QTE44102.1 DNA (cytosine-5-)-methyltransferase [Mucilaginibacter rubeus]QTE50703.1 DNA (cytosine-5-)-methyltransferase [Mucilaginibacter rubeus]QTE55785.1 DNA (cytosine-5-)-methyltransferase [Mucilaginibacter rubeus]
MREVKFIDLFAGIGGLRLGFEEAFKKVGFDTKCVMTSEIKPHALKVLHHNFSHDYFVGDITKVKNHEIPDFDFLLGGFPCQPFSAGGKRQGFVDTRGTLFFEIERILEDKKPYGFILENVEGLVKHDLENKKDEFGRTLKTILSRLASLGYKVSTKVLNAADFGLPQSRKRIFIVGTLDEYVPMSDFEIQIASIKNILEKGLPTMDSKFVNLLLSHFTIDQLFGKSIKDKRGGENNIHSWDIELKGAVSKEQATLLNLLFKQRRKKQWAEQIGIKWMDGMPLTLAQIRTFYDAPNLEEMLSDLVKKKYLKFEYPKSLVTEHTLLGDKTYRRENKSLKPGYNIVSGKLSYAINKILDPNGIAPTLVATDMARLVVPDGNGLRSMTLREGLRLFGFPEWFEMPVSTEEGFDLLGNTVAVNVVNRVAQRVAELYLESQSIISSMPVCSA